MRNWGVPNTTSRRDVGGLDHPSGSLRADTQRDPNSLADHSPPGRLNLSIVRDASFLRKKELNQVQRIDAELDHREFAACVFWSVFITVVFGLPIAAATAFMSWG